MLSEQTRSDMSSRSKVALIALFSAVLLPWAGFAQSAETFPGTIPNNVRFRLGSIFSSVRSDLKLSATNQQGDEIPLTGLGLLDDRANTFRGEGYWNFLGRSFLDFGYVQYNTSGSRTITKDIHIDDVIYKAGASVAADQKARFIYGAYRWNFVKNPAVQVGISLGISYATLKDSLSASASVTKPDGTVIQGGATASKEISVPVPLLGLMTEFAIVDGLEVSLYGRGVGATIDPWHGTWAEFGGQLTWFFARNFGVGGAYEYQKILIEKNKNGSLSRFDQRYEGPRAFLALTF
jgi:hypothetical protein